MPILTSFGLPMVGYGLMYGYWLSIAGAVVLLTGLYGWALEPDAE
jgi:cytochrome c oxidase subunit 1